MTRRLAILVGAMLMAAIAPTAGSAQAQVPQATQTYRYWSYWIGGDAWSYSARGPGFRVPPDGGVEGWRFVVSPKDGSQASPPATSSRFDDLCPGQPPAPAGQKRIAVVIDPGAPGIAPVGNKAPPKSVNCITAASAATGLQVLQQVTTLRFQSSGLICGIAGFPASECPGQAAAPPSTPKPTAGSGATPASTSRGAAPVAPVAPVDMGADSEPFDAAPSAAATPAATPSVPLAAGSPAPSAVAMTFPDSPTDEPGGSPPAWIAAIGAGMIAALLGLAMLIRRGRS